MTTRGARPPANRARAAAAQGATGGLRRRVAQGSLAQRLVTAHLVVVFVMAIAAIVGAVIVGPAVFDAHMRQAGHGDHPELLEHAQQAFRSAGLTALLLGLAAAAICAMIASLAMARRLGGTLDALADAAEGFAAGDHSRRVALGGGGREVDAVADAFNSMADQIEQTETTRRRLLTDLAHELRTPVAVIDVTLEGIEDGVVALDDRAMQILRDQTDRLVRLVHDVRDVSAAEEGRLALHPRDVAVADLVATALATAGPAAAAKGVRLATDSATPDVRLVVDPARLGQVLDNLLRNAIQHTPAGGDVRLQVTTGHGWVRMSVADTGVGISAEHLPHVFERFYRVPSGDEGSSGAPGGTGVGLAISRAIVQAHGGTLEATSPGAGRGATFTVTLPLRCADADADAAAALTLPLR